LSPVPITRPRRRSVTDGPPPERVTFVLPDVAAVRQLAGSLAHLATRKHVVHVGVAADPPGAPSLGLFDGSYQGLTVQALPTLPDDPWRALRTLARARTDRRASSRVGKALARLERAAPAPAGVEAWLEAHRPDVLVVARLEGAACVHLDYLRAAHVRGIPTIFLPLSQDDVARAGLAGEMPGCVAVWNRAQRSEAIDAGVPSRRTCVTGAHLATDVLDRRSAVDRGSFAGNLGIEPGRALIVYTCTGRTAAGVVDAVRAWNAARIAHPAERVRSSAVIVRAWAQDGAVDLAAAALPGVVDVQSGVLARDFHEDARRLHLALAHADVVVTADAGLAIEGLARAVPVVAVAGEPALDALCARARREHAWPRVAQTVEAQLGEVASILREPPDPVELSAARGFVRIHGDEIEPGFLFASRLIRKVQAPDAPEPVSAGASLPFWAGLARALVSPPARPASTGGKALLLFALPDAGSMVFWAPVMDAMVARGHRVLASSDRGAANQGPRAGVRHVAAPETFYDARGWRGLAAGVDVMLSMRVAPESAVGVRWRRLLEQTTFPASVRRLEVLMDRADACERLRASAARLDRSLAASAAARRLIDRERPDAVVLFPSLDAGAALACRMAHADLARAARARGVPVADGLLGSGAVADTIAHGAVRTRGLSRSAADAIAAELEEWLRTAPAAPQAARPLVAQAAGFGIVGRARLAIALKILEARTRSLLSLASRARSATR